MVTDQMMMFVGLLVFCLHNVVMLVVCIDEVMVLVFINKSRSCFSERQTAASHVHSVHHVHLS